MTRDRTLAAFGRPRLGQIFALLNRGYTEELEREELEAVIALRERLKARALRYNSRGFRRLFYNIVMDKLWVNNINGQLWKLR